MNTDLISPSQCPKEYLFSFFACCSCEWVGDMKLVIDEVVHVEECPHCNEAVTLESQWLIGE